MITYINSYILNYINVPGSVGITVVLVVEGLEDVSKKSVKVADSFLIVVDVRFADSILIVPVESTKLLVDTYDVGTAVEFA